MAAREINTQRSIKTAIIRAPCLPELEGVRRLDRVPECCESPSPSEGVCLLCAV